MPHEVRHFLHDILQAITIIETAIVGKSFAE